MDVQAIKRTFGIIGTDPELDRAIGIAAQVAATDLTVLITGESGTGKDVFPKIIHQNSARKHGQYFAVNCGAIPRELLIQSCLATRKALLRALSMSARATSRLLTKALCSWTRSESCLFPHKPDCCVFWRTASLSA